MSDVSDASSALEVNAISAGKLTGAKETVNGADERVQDPAIHHDQSTDVIRPSDHPGQGRRYGGVCSHG